MPVELLAVPGAHGLDVGEVLGARRGLVGLERARGNHGDPGGDGDGGNEGERPCESPLHDASVHLGHDRLLERRDEALERALHAQRLLDLALEPCDLVLLGLVSAPRRR